jgi:large subunit ribosomal protein L17
MRHNVKGRKLKRTASHRLATLRALGTALLRYKKIKTTLAKAKETRMFVEPIITKAKIDSVHTRRLVAEDIHDKDVVKELFTETVKKIGERPGGYTRIVKLGHRRGDAAEMAILELVDFNDLVAKKKAAAGKKAKKEDAKAEDAVVIEETKEEKKAK